MLFPFLNKPQDKTYVIFSPMEGILSHNGKPLPHARIIRELSWNANEKGIVDDFQTDENGRFSLPQYDSTFKINVLTQFVACQYLTIEYDGKKDEIWHCGKLSEALFGEVGHQLKSLECDLTNDFIRIGGDITNVLMTKCRWENIELENFDE